MTPSEIFVYVVAVLCGISMLMPVNAIFSAPSYILFFYKYATHEAVQVPKYTNFWANVLSYYNLVSFGVSLIMEPLVLTRLFSRVNLLLRMLAGLIILIVEIALFLIVPAVGTNEVGCIVTLVMGGFISGTGKSIFESTAYGMFGAFPSRYLSAVMGGAGISGALTSVLQMIIRGALPEDQVPMQAKIFYGLAVGIQGTTFICLIIMRFNGFAQQYVASWAPAGSTSSELQSFVSPTNEPAEGEVNLILAPVNPDVDARAKNEELASDNDGDQVQAVDADAAIETIGDGPDMVQQSTKLDSHEIARQPMLPIFKAIWPMLIACAFNFFITLMLFPTVVVSVDNYDYWYGTSVVLVFNVLDMVGRFTPTLKFTWPKTHGQRWIITAASLARVIFLPLLLLASYHYIPSHAFSYVMMVIFGFSNGYIGSMAMTLAPRSRGLVQDGQRFIAGIMMSLSILVGGACGTALSIMIQTLRANAAA